jgi:hypothetical protein
MGQEKESLAGPLGEGKEKAGCWASDPCANKMELAGWAKLRRRKLRGGGGEEKRLTTIFRVKKLFPIFQNVLLISKLFFNLNQVLILILLLA